MPKELRDMTEICPRKKERHGATVPRTTAVSPRQPISAALILGKEVKALPSQGDQGPAHVVHKSASTSTRLPQQSRRICKAEGRQAGVVVVSVCCIYIVLLM